MKWPWVSRERLEDQRQRVQDVKEQMEGRISDLEGENEWLREQQRELQGQLVRLVRVRSGAPEEPRAPREEVGPMPQMLKDYVRGFGSSAIQKQQSDLAIKRRRSGESWASICKDLTGMGLNGEDDGGE